MLKRKVIFLIHTLLDLSDGAERFQKEKIKVEVKPNFEVEEKICLKLI